VLPSQVTVVRAASLAIEIVNRLEHKNRIIHASSTKSIESNTTTKKTKLNTTSWLVFPVLAIFLCLRSFHTPNHHIVSSSQQCTFRLGSLAWPKPLVERRELILTALALKDLPVQPTTSFDLVAHLLGHLLVHLLRICIGNSAENRLESFDRVQETKTVDLDAGERVCRREGGVEHNDKFPVGVDAPAVEDAQGAEGIGVNDQAAVETRSLEDEALQS
jgi:hypothetical protein